MPGIERGVDRADALVLVGIAVCTGHAHAAEPGPGYLRAAVAERCRPHRAPSIPVRSPSQQTMGTRHRRRGWAGAGAGGTAVSRGRDAAVNRSG